MQASSPIPPASVDALEVDKFRALAGRWWDPSGPMRPLHLLNPCRVGWIRDRVLDHLGRPRGGMTPLAGLDLLDIGCGGGLLSEPMCRLGARVTGIDPTDELVEVARWHAQETGLSIDYRNVGTSDLAATGGTFDVVLASEVIEHVPDPAAFLADVAATTRPGGIVILSTLSRTWRSWLLAIVGAEYALRWLPPGTHAWQRFLRPSELSHLLRQSGLRATAMTGIAYDPADATFRTVRDTSVNYLLAAVRG